MRDLTIPRWIARCDLYTLVKAIVSATINIIGYEKLDKYKEGTMRDAMKAADEAKRFTRIGFDIISLRSENRHRIGPENLSGVSKAQYEKPSDIILRVKAELDYMRDKKNTESVLDQIR